MAKSKQSITWTNERRKLSDLIPWEHNPRTIKNAQAERLVDSVETFGQVETLAVGPGNALYNGHQRASVLAGKYGMDYEVDVRVASRELTERERQQLTVYLHRGSTGEWVFEDLLTWDHSDLINWGFSAEELNIDFDDEPTTAGTDTEPQVSKADELKQIYGVQIGQLWRLPSRNGKGEHRLFCGDCTDPANIHRLMGGEKSALCHADPPYGMGKEKDGIANDNLYRDKLDVFQMQWWRAARPYIDDNGSAYIWGNAEDLWRLWYCGGLRDSERLTFRSQVIWDKPPSASSYGSPIGSEKMRSYPHGYEVSLFFMLGEQGFNNNADNYWDGWEPIRGYLDGERVKTGWSKPDVERILGSINKTQHIFSNSHFNLITEFDYKKLQSAAKGNAFKREYDDLKREYDDLKREYDDLKRDFYATRAYFDNTHDNMTDVWSFPRVTGDDRHEHATPKPVAMIERAIKSSCPAGGLVYVPFGGTCPEIIASENTNRYVRAVELSAEYCAVILDRFHRHTGIKPELLT